MTVPQPKYDRKDIGSSAVRIPAAGMPDILDVAIDPYAPTKTAKQVFIRGFQAWPQKGGPFPAVILLHEWWGLNSHFQELTFRLAQHGYVALVVDQYSRIGGAVTSDPENAAQLMGKVKLSELTQDLGAACEYLNFQEYVKKNRFAVLGFCMGGSNALSYACARRQLRAAVAFYGKVPQESLATLQCPVLYHQAEHDDWITQKEVDYLADTLTARKVICEVHKYPGTSHAFFNDTRPEVYNAEASSEAWARTLTFLDKYILADHLGVRPLPDSQRVR